RTRPPRRSAHRAAGGRPEPARRVPALAGPVVEAGDGEPEVTLRTTCPHALSRRAGMSPAVASDGPRGPAVTSSHGNRRSLARRPGRQLRGARLQRLAHAQLARAQPRAAVARDG